jgi:myxalamid-type polyketide synthase MxaE and MxaD
MSMADARSVAIIGIGCRFPGGADDPEQFWTMLCEGRQAVDDIPADRIDLQRYYHATPKTPGKTIARYGGYLKDIDYFDPEFFAISPREAERIDPQQRLLLETSWEAIENAGIDIASLVGARVGVYVGQWQSDFEQRLFLHPDELDFAMTLGSGRYAASGRIAYAFGFRGPTLTLDTACSSSLYAVHLAVQSLRSGETSLALAGAANVILAPHTHIAYSQSGMMAPDGRCKFGDAAADGYVRSEGAAILVLKRLDAALSDGDRIHVVIRGSAVNNDGGSSGSMGRPSLLGQSELVRSALADAGIEPTEIAYVEAHGTGTRAGDGVEIGALAAALGGGRSQPLLVGSIKTNIGHTEAAAGAAGLIKAALSVRNGFIPPSLNVETLNPAIPWDRISVAIAREATRWPSEGPRVAGVSGYGISGANAHVIVEAPPPPADAASEAPLPILLLSAHSEAALRARAAGVAAQLASPEAPLLDDLLRFQQTRRSAMGHRAAFLAEDAVQLRQALGEFSRGGPALAEGVADRHYGVAHLQAGRVGEFHGRQAGHVLVDLDDGDVLGDVDPDDVRGVVARAALDVDGDARRPRDDVVVRQDLAGRADQHPGSGRLAVAEHGVDVHDRRPHLGGDGLGARGAGGGRARPRRDLRDRGQRLRRVLGGLVVVDGAREAPTDTGAGRRRDDGDQDEEGSDPVPDRIVRDGRDGRRRRPHRRWRAHRCLRRWQETLVSLSGIAL